MNSELEFSLDQKTGFCPNCKGPRNLKTTHRLMEWKPNNIPIPIAVLRKTYHCENCGEFVFTLVIEDDLMLE